MGTQLVEQPSPVVLVVDEVEANRQLLEGYLADLGYEVRQASDGVEPFAEGERICLPLRSTVQFLPIILTTTSAWTTPVTQTISRDRTSHWAPGSSRSRTPGTR